MALLNSYVIWNNKGGVGKTTLTFHMATQYAKSHPKQKVLVIDLCPQANVSMALLGSLPDGGNTISSYLQEVTSPLSNVNPQNFLTHAYEFNDQIPPNLELLCGDMQLEYVGRSLDHMREGYATPTYNPWVFITSCVRYFIVGYMAHDQTKQMQGVTNDDNDWVVFIDTSPSFAVYTEMALVAAQKLIIPVNADDFSREAITAMLDLVYGIDAGNVPDNLQVYRERMFHRKAQQYDVRRPQIDLVINNRATRYDTRSAKAFKAMYESIVAVFEKARENNNEIFAPEGFPDFEDIQDFHTAGVVALHTGCPLENLQSRVEVFSDQVIKINLDQLKIYQDDLNRLVNRL